jgi:hypothetical protein
MWERVSDVQNTGAHKVKSSRLRFSATLLLSAADEFSIYAEYK